MRSLLMLLFRRLTAVLDPVTRGWLVVTGGSLARLAVGFVASVVIARTLGPTAFGIYAVLAASGMIAGAVADLGLTNAAVRRTASSWPASPTHVQQVWSVFFWLRIALAGVVAGVGILLSDFLVNLLDIGDHKHLLWLVLVGVVATAASGAVSAMLQATSHFGRLSIVLLTNACLTALLAVILSEMGQLTLTTALIVLGIGTSLVSYLVGYQLLPGRWPLIFPRRQDLRTHGSDLLRYGSWLWVGSIFAVFAAHLDVLLVNRWSVSATVGAYALALTLSTKVEVVNHSLYTVLLPAASSADTPESVRQYVRSGMLRSVVISLGLALLFPLARPFILTFYGSMYEPAIGLFQGLLCVAIFNVLIAPLLMLAFTYDQPKLLASADALRVGSLAIVGIMLIPVYGPTGAIAARFIAAVAGAALIVGILARRSIRGEGTVESV